MRKERREKPDSQGYHHRVYGVEPYSERPRRLLATGLSPRDWFQEVAYLDVKTRRGARAHFEPEDVGLAGCCGGWGLM